MECSRSPAIAAAKAGRGGLVAIAVGQPGSGQIALGPQHDGDMSGLVGIEQGEQFTGGGNVPHLEGGARGQLPLLA